MSIFEEERNLLPGVTTEVELSFSEDFDTSMWGTTESVAIIGTAFDGPVNKPVRLYSPEYARFVFGDVYNHRTKKEATLVKEFMDAWDKGCRTIWGIRVSGKPLYRDFQLATTDDYSLRVSATFPSNSNKDCYFVYDNKHNQNKITIYKPNSRATMAEKLRGLSDLSKPMIKIDIDLANYNLTRNHKLTELVSRFNSQPRNNVMRLSIVDKHGNDITSRMDLTGDLTLASMFPGAYFIGRDTNNVYATTSMKYNIEKEYDEYGDLIGKISKDLSLNTDINKDLPIYGEELKDLNVHFAKRGLIMTKMFDFLENYEIVDKIYAKDKIDYEEADLTDFELYKRLGSGFATTAKAEFRKGKSGDIKVIETPVEDSSHVIAIRDGVYSTIENLDTDYRVLASANADAIIRDRMPRKQDFKSAIPLNKIILNDKVEVTSKVKSDDITNPRSFKFEVDAFSPDEDMIEEFFEDGKLYGEKSITHLPYLIEDDEEQIDENKKVKALKEGEMFLVFKTKTSKAAKLYRKGSKKSAIIDKSEMLGELIYSKGMFLEGVKGNIEKEEENKEELDLEFKAVEGKTFGKEPMFMVKGLMNEAGTAQKKATLDEVVEFLAKPQITYEKDESGENKLDKDGKPIILHERKGVNFKKENLKITEDKIEITGQLLTKKDWDELKSSPEANKDLPYKITVLYEGPGKDKACKIAITRDEAYLEFDKEEKDQIEKAMKFKEIARQNGIENMEDISLDKIDEANKEDDESVIFKEKKDFREDAKFFIVSSGKRVNIYTKEEDEIKPYASMSDIMSDDEDKTFVVMENIPTLDEEDFNLVSIRSSAFDYTTLDDLVNMLNDHPSIREFFEFNLTPRGAVVKDAYIVDDFEEKESEVFEQTLPIEAEYTDRDISYDVNKYIPFKTSDNFARQLAQHCLVTSLKTGDTHGVIGVKTITNTDLDSVKERTIELLEKEYDLFAKRDNGRTMLSSTSDEPYSIGDKISIVAHQYPLNTGEGYLTVSNGASGYAGMVSALPLDRSSTNQSIAINTLSYEYSNYQIQNLNQKGYVVFKDSYKKGIVVNDGITAAPINSPLKRLSSVKILKAVKDLIRTEAEPFIGLRNNLFNRSSLETAIDSSMAKLKGVLLEDYTFRVDSSRNRAKLGILDIYFSIVPYNEIRNINAKIRVVDEIGIQQQNM